MFINIKNTIYRLKLALQRALYGYDDSMWYNLDESFIKLYIKLLTKLRDDSVYHQDKKLHNNISNMIIHLEKMEAYKNNSTKRKEFKLHKDKFFKLFSENFTKLWD